MQLTSPALTGRLRASLIVALMIGIPYAAALVRRWSAPAPAFDDASAYIDASSSGISPDGKVAYVFLQHPGRFSYQDSLWAIDTETLERTLLPDPAVQLHPLMPLNIPCIATVPAWDGRQMLGALQGTGNATFFAIDLATRETRSIDWDTFSSAANHGGWKFERVRPMHGEGPGSLRASRPGDALAEPYLLDTWRDPAVAMDDPMQVFYTAADGVVHHLDAGTGVDAALALENTEGHVLRVSSDARWLTLHEGRGRTLLFEVGTGRSREVTGSAYPPMAGDFPILRGSNREENPWTLGDLDGDRTFVTEVPVSRLIRARDGRFLGIDAESEAAYLFDASGVRVATLRPPVERKD